MSKVINTQVPAYIALARNFGGLTTRDVEGEPRIVKFSSFKALIEWLITNKNEYLTDVDRLDPFSPDVKITTSCSHDSVKLVKIDVADRPHHNFPWHITHSGIFDCNEATIDTETLEHCVNNDYIFIGKWRDSESSSFGLFIDVKDRWRQELLDMLDSMQACGDMGCSREITFYADGDGDFRPRFAFDTSLFKPTTGELKLKFDAG